MKCLCGADMEVRFRRYDNNPFWGCTKYPSCKNTKPYNNENIGEETSTETTVEKPKFKPSKYQEAIYDFIKNGKGNAVVEAVAGSGKTTTLVEALQYTEGDVLFCAFNKHIANELATKAPDHVMVSTLHSVGYSIIRNNVDGKVNVDDKKLVNLIEKHVPPPMNETDGVKRISIVNFLRRTIPLIKATMLDHKTKKKVKDLCDKYGIDEMTYFKDAYEYIDPILCEAKSMTNVIDFDDMCWLPVVCDMSFPQYDWLFIDEAQDLSTNQMELVLRLRKKRKGRIVAVGDRMQSIYGFRGADCEAIPNLVKKTKSKILPLNICYRCPSSHIKLAKEIVPQIEAFEGNGEGEVNFVKEELVTENLQDGDMVLCRVNAPLVSIAFNLIKQGKKAIVRGRDIGKGLIVMIEKLSNNYSITDVADFMVVVNEFCVSECAKLEKQNKESAANSLRDKCECLSVFASMCKTVPDMKIKILDIFSDKQVGIVCSSVHKAKGLEADNVSIIKYNLIPFPKCTQEWELKQEDNIKYVALTRAKKTLCISSDSGE